MWCPAARRAMRASATLKSPPGCGARNSTNAPFLCVKPRSSGPFLCPHSRLPYPSRTLDVSELIALGYNTMRDDSRRDYPVQRGTTPAGNSLAPYHRFRGDVRGADGRGSIAPLSVHSLDGL